MTQKKIEWDNKEIVVISVSGHQRFNYDMLHIAKNMALQKLPMKISEPFLTFINYCYEKQKFARTF
jgi:hypothetical protein